MKLTYFYRHFQNQGSWNCLQTKVIPNRRNYSTNSSCSIKGWLPIALPQFLLSMQLAD